MTSIANTRRSRQRGSAMLETAFVLVSMTMLMLGIIEFGRAMWVYNTLSHSARAALRYALVRGEENPATDDQIAAVAHANAPGLVATDMGVVTTFSPNRERGSVVAVRVTYPFRFVISPALDAGAPLTLNLRSTSAGIVSQ